MDAIKKECPSKKKSKYCKTISEMKEQMLGGELKRLQSILDAKEKIREIDDSVFELNAEEADDDDEFDDEIIYEDEEMVKGSVVRGKRESLNCFPMNCLSPQVPRIKEEPPKEEPVVNIIKNEEVFDDDEFFY